MLGIALRIVAAFVFLLAAVNQTVLHQGPADLVAWGLLAWVLATLFGGFGPQWTFTRQAPPA